MKISRYNFIFEFEDKILAYNALSGAFAIIEEDVRKMLESEQNLEKFKDKNERNRKIYDALKEGKFIVDFDELTYIDYLYNSLKFRKDVLGLTIAPTMNCNFSCKYCYEVRKNTYMTDEVRKAVVDFVKMHLENVKHLSVSWYGGEPLLDFKTVEELSKEFIKMCKDMGVEYNASMVTNGYLLNKEIAEALRELKIITVQVTLDGTRETHDRRRKLLNNQGTFNVIVDNIRNVRKYFKHVSIRINIDKTNEENVLNLLNYLKTEGLADGNCSPYLAFVDASTEVCKGIAVSCMDISNRSKYTVTKAFEALEKGINIIKYPSPMYSQCGAVKPNSFVIDPDGNLYKCWHEVGNVELSIGDLRNKNEIKNFDRYLKWLTFNPLNYKECKECKFLPLCMGGCPDKTLFKHKGISEEGCSMYKYNLEEILKLHLKAKLKNGFIPIPV